jgi:hypothetical protein
MILEPILDILLLELVVDSNLLLLISLNNLLCTIYHNCVTYIYCYLNFFHFVILIVLCLFVAWFVTWTQTLFASTNPPRPISYSIHCMTEYGSKKYECKCNVI